MYGRYIKEKSHKIGEVINQTKIVLVMVLGTVHINCI